MSSSFHVAAPICICTKDTTHMGGLSLCCSHAMHLASGHCLEVFQRIGC